MPLKPLRPNLPQLFKMSTRHLAEYIEPQATHKGKKWWYIPGSLAENVTVCAHIDTACDRGTGPQKVWDYEKKEMVDAPAKTKDRDMYLYYDRQKEVFWCPEGLGADDRAGVHAAFHLYDTMFPRPNLLFLDEEESGCTGARDAATEGKTVLKNTLFFVEFDRRGVLECIFYQNEPKPFEDYVVSFGLTKEMGTMSDVGTLSRELEICGVNLSIGYIDEHRNTERLYMKAHRTCIAVGRNLIVDGMKAGKRWENPRPVVAPSMYETRGAYGYPSFRYGEYGQIIEDDGFGDPDYYYHAHARDKSALVVPVGKSLREFGCPDKKVVSQIPLKFKDNPHMTFKERVKAFKRKWRGFTKEEFDRHPYLADQRDIEWALIQQSKDSSTSLFARNKSQRGG